MKIYQKLDAAIIRSLPCRSVLYAVGAVGFEAGRVAVFTDREKHRVIDGRLQALRKAGKIKFDSKTGWAVVTA